MPAIKITKKEKIKRMFQSRRRELSYSQEVVAKHFSVKQSTISGWERDYLSMNADMYVKYCKYLKIPKEKALNILWEGNTYE